MISLTNTDIFLNQVIFIHHILKWSCAFKYRQNSYNILYFKKVIHNINFGEVNSPTFVRAAPLHAWKFSLCCHLLVGKPNCSESARRNSSTMSSRKIQLLSSHSGVQEPFLYRCFKYNFPKSQWILRVQFSLTRPTGCVSDSESLLIWCSSELQWMDLSF